MLTILQVAPVTTPCLNVNTHRTVVLPSISALLASPYHIGAPPNPSSPTFAGWLPTNDVIPGWMATPTASLEPLSGNYATVTLDDHSYADHTPLGTQITTVTCNSK